MTPPPANPTLQERLSELKELHGRVETEPYSIVLRLKLAVAYKQLGYPDLAAGDSYKALLLVDEVCEEGEFHEEALSAAEEDLNQDFPYDLEAAAGVGEAKGDTKPDLADLSIDDDEDEAVFKARKVWSRVAYGILVGSLIDCGCFRSAFEYNTRALKAFPEDPVFAAYKKRIAKKLRAYFDSRGDNIDAAEISEYPDRGMVRRELYPWNEHEPNRFSEECLDFLNEEMNKVAPKLEVRVATLPILSPGNSMSQETSSAEKEEKFVKQLGIFAKEDIPAGEVILQEKSLLTAVSRMHESFCDACSISLPTSGDAAEEIRACEECDEVLFCSAECEELAQDSYHPSICGVTIDKKVSASRAADHLYSLLLVRALALAETQEAHPLELKEVRYIWGDYHGLDLNTNWKSEPQGNLFDPFGSVPQTLPFSFEDNILMPLNVLERMDINIFEQSHRYDTWIFNTLYGKFRGTASARQGLDGRPEVSAVHPLWCLGNHSCDPNVAWEWQGSIRFWTREQLLEWKDRPENVKPGIRKGEELMSHYCDVTLPVKERREWAVGALGGDCMCPRCLWEAKQEEQHRTQS